MIFTKVKGEKTAQSPGTDNAVTTAHEHDFKMTK